jgi:transcriptional regulator with XRE-family HTH domain
VCAVHPTVRAGDAGCRKSACATSERARQFLTRLARPGYCSLCAGWLGDANTTNNAEAVLNESGWKGWSAQVVGGLLAHAPELQVTPSKERIALMVRACLDRYANGKVSMLARLLGMSDKTLQQYLQEGKVPLFSTLLKMCYRLAMTPLEFLTQEVPVSQQDPFSNDALVTSRKKYQALTEEDLRHVELALDAVLAKKPYPPHFWMKLPRN